MMKRKLAIACISFGLFSCGNLKYSDEIQKIETALNALDSCQIAIDSLNPKQLSTLKGEVGSKIDFIQENYPDSMPKTLATHLGEYRKAFKRLKSVNASYEFVSENCSYTKQQLSDLKSVLAADQLGELSFEKAFSSEIEGVEATKKELAGLNQRFENVKRQESGLRPRVDSIVISLKKRGYN